uniref:Uncharacterized protein LOC116946262 n=1 Tax=Petromyzon marinus TaxID=7757 RepID=A0AAJ7TG13_PETMA|nr:uncharacterized protein LOC116946262 [Petromyzon marinus]XP_032817181.1 uncharacterized protein LOC116946262 [Petromyzon marinus]
MPRHAKELPMGGPWWQRQQQQQRKQQEDREQIHNQKHNQGQQQKNQQQQAQDHLLQQEHLQQLERQQQTNPDRQHNHQEQDCHQQDQYDLSQKQNQQLDEHAQKQQEQQQPQDQLVNEYEQRYHQQQQQQQSPPLGSDPTAPDRDADASDDHYEKEEEEAWCRPRGPQGPWADASLLRRYSPAVVGLLQARLDPARSGDGAWFAGLSLPATPGGDFLLHSCKAVVHVACHLLGMAHCRWLACLMQGARSAAMARARPPHLCPVCLHKLHHAAAFRLAPRYRCLLDWVRSQTTPDDNERTGDSDDLTPPRAQQCGDNSGSTGRQPTESAEHTATAEERRGSPASHEHRTATAEERRGSPASHEHRTATAEERRGSPASHEHRTATAEERRGSPASHEHRTATAAEDGVLRDAGDSAAMDAGERGSLVSFERWLLACLDQLRGDDEAGDGGGAEDGGQEAEGLDETPPDWDRALEELRERTRQSRARRGEAEAGAKEVDGGGGGSLRGFLNARVSTLRRQLKGNSSFRQMAEVRSIAEKSCKSLRAKLSVSDRKALHGAASQNSGISRDKCRKPDQ